MWAIITLLLFTGAWFPHTALSQQLPTRIFTELDGLPSNAIFGITQDKQGEMWFASRGGVARYDGHQWTSYGRRHGLLRDNFRRITTDRNGMVWAVTLTSPFSVSFFSNEEWHSLPSPTLENWGWDLTAFTTHIREDGTILLALSSATSITLWDGEMWQSLEALGDFPAISAMEFVGENLWVATAIGLRGIDIGQNKYLEEPAPGLPPGPVLGIALTKDGLEIDLLGPQWIGTIKHGRFDLMISEMDVAMTKIDSGVTLVRGPAGGWYFGDQANLHYYHKTLGLENLTLSSGMASIGATNLFLDRENNIWVGSLRGVTRICGRCISSYDQKQGLLGNEVTAVLQLRSGAIILGHCNGITFFDSPIKTLPFPQLPGLSSRVMGLAEGPNGLIWIAADRYGLGYLDNQRKLHWIPETRFPKQGTFAVLFDEQNQLWIGGSHGLFRKEGNDFVQFPLPEMDPLLSPFVRRLSLDNNGAIMVATGMHGVYRLTGDQIDHWVMHGNNGVAQGSFCTFARQNGDYFVGTNAGLYRIKNNKMEKSVAPDPQIDRPIYSITRDSAGNIWFGSDVGALRWDGTKLDQFDVNDGLLGNETNRDALLLDDKNDMWIGTDQGLSIYRNEFDLKVPGKPLVSLEEIQVGENIFSAETPLELPSSPLEIIVRFKGITMLQENNLQFRTWLNPFQSNWQETRKIPSHEIRYSHLKPGTYTFQIQAVRSDGIASDIVHSQTITVLPPVWQTWWFISITLLVAMVLLWSVLSYLSNRRYTLRLKVAVQEKTAELQASETAVKIESQRLSTTLQNISDGVLAVSSQNIITLANPAAVAIMGRPAKEILGAELETVFTLLNLETDKPQHDSKLENELPQLFTFTTPKGLKKYLEISTSHIENQKEHPGGKVMALRDITDRRQLEKELLRTQKLESLGVLAGGIAHDFNNLLTIMLGNLALVENSEGLTDQERHLLSRMKQATIRSQSLANQLLTFSMGGSPQLETAHVNDLIPMAVSFALSGSSVEYNFQVDPNVRCIRVDPGQFDQVISNLVINASQAMNGNGILTICVKEVPHRTEFQSEGTHVMIEVKDKGCGIEPHILGKIFDPYFTSKDTGSGLGLATVYSIINKHGGYLAVESTIGQGTSFQIFLPAFHCEKEESTQKDRLNISAMESILILDDEPDVREILSRMLADMGYASVSFDDGVQAITAYSKALAEGRPYSAVIADLTIPGGMGGKEMIKHLLEIDPDVKALVVSGYSTDSVMSDYTKFGFAGAVRKPFDQVTLSHSLQEILANH